MKYRQTLTICSNIDGEKEEKSCALPVDVSIKLMDDRSIEEIINAGDGKLTGSFNFFRNMIDYESVPRDE